jgi:hypothetical protein
LIPGLYGDSSGLLAKFHDNYTNETLTTTCGYILWCPEYTPSTSAPQKNIVVCNSTTSSVGPTAVGAFVGNGFFDGNLGTYLADPASGFNAGTVCGDMQLLSSCIRMRYIGPLLNVQGEIVAIQGLPGDQLAPPGLTIPSVDDLFKYGYDVKRLGSETEEVVSINDHTPAYHDSAIGALLTQVGSNPALPDQVKAVTPSFYGFAWRGLPTGTNKFLTFDLTKNVSWRPSADSGLNQVPRTITGANDYDKYIKYLERVMGSTWWNNLTAQATTTAFGTAGRLFSGRGNGMQRLRYSGPN